MEEEKLKEAVRKANEAVKGVDPDLKQAAFQTILSKLLEHQEDSHKKMKKKAGTKRARIKRGKKIEMKKIDEVTAKLMREINRTEYPKMLKLTSALERSLYLLKICREDLGVDGLTSSQISSILLEAFRIKTTSNAVSMALMKAVKYVHRKPVTIQGGSGYTYHIMNEGEKYLEKKLRGADVGEMGKE